LLQGTPIYPQVLVLFDLQAQDVGVTSVDSGAAPVRGASAQ
jgi:hypothetical protein